MSVCGGANHTLALSKSYDFYDVYGFGRNDENQLGFLNQYDKGEVGKVGDDRNLFESTPKKIIFPDETVIKKIVAREHFSYGYSDNCAYSWGNCESFVLGNKKEEGKEEELLKEFEENLKQFEKKKEEVNNGFIK